MKFISAIIILACLFPFTTNADERILSYKSEIEVLVDGSMKVKETIVVRAERNRIKRGIYRDFPTLYKDRFGNDYRVAFDIERVLRDGVTETYHTKSESNGIRLYIGHKDHFLTNGEYTYTIRYRTDRQLGFFESFDELYWNVTGNGWIFPIDEVIAEIRLPSSIPNDTLALDAYTGLAGAKGKHFQSSLNAGMVIFQTTRSLSANEGMTISVTWPKGYVTEPDLAQNIGYILDDNYSLLLGLIGLLIVALYYIFVWNKVGRDPEAGVIFPHYYPEKGYSPASMRYISRMGYDHKTFATAIVNLAAKGAVEIDDTDSTKYQLTRLFPTTLKLAAGEKVLLEKLFSKSHTVILENSNHRLIQKSIAAHKKSLSNDYNKIYFKMNSVWLLPGFIVSLATVAAIFLTVKSSVGEESLFLLIWLSGWTVGVIVLSLIVFRLWQAALSGQGYLGAIGMTLFALPFFSAELFVIWKFQFSIPLVLTVASIISANILFYHLLKAPTRAGRKLLDKIEGFKMYLDVAEKDELNLKNPPEKTPEIFEIYLAYAMALDVEQHWAEKFTSVFARLEEQGKHYQPSWYHGSHFHTNNLTNFTSAIGSNLSSAISSSSTAPGSSSGSGGGGSSGGGGGGGGGGGW